MYLYLPGSQATRSWRQCVPHQSNN